MQPDPNAGPPPDPAAPAGSVALEPPVPPRTPAWRRRDSLPLWAQLCVIALLLGLCGVLIGQLFSLQRSIDSARADASAARERIAALNSQLTNAQSLAATAEQSAQAAQSLAATAGKSAEASASGAIAGQQASLQSQQAALAQQQQQLTAEIGALNASKFSDGLFQVGRDIQPGQYHTEGVHGCTGRS